jgi:hypothetical protein
LQQATPVLQQATPVLQQATPVLQQATPVWRQHKWRFHLEQKAWHRLRRPGPPSNPAKQSHEPANRESKTLLRQPAAP